ncbi:MAG: hypothetical protein ABI652_06135, partial [Acidobacteriota bacterium]
DLEAQLVSVRAQMLLPEFDSFQDRSVRRRSITDLRALESDLLARLAALTTASPRRRQFFAVTSKGLSQ